MSVPAGTGTRRRKLALVFAAVFLATGLALVLVPPRLGRPLLWGDTAVFYRGLRPCFLQWRKRPARGEAALCAVYSGLEAKRADDFRRRLYELGLRYSLFRPGGKAAALGGEAVSGSGGVAVVEFVPRAADEKTLAELCAEAEKLAGAFAGGAPGAYVRVAVELDVE